MMSDEPVFFVAIRPAIWCMGDAWAVWRRVEGAEPKWVCECGTNEKMANYIAGLMNQARVYA